jgi:hypothetical protein
MTTHPLFTSLLSFGDILVTHLYVLINDKEHSPFTLPGDDMKLRNCFVDHDGNIWHERTLIQASNHLSIKPWKLSTASLNELIRWKLLNVQDYVVHYNRVRNADLTIPIILRDDGYPMDGWHRIIKAHSEDVNELPSKQFTENPEPDFKCRCR